MAIFYGLGTKKAPHRQWSFKRDNKLLNDIFSIIVDTNSR